MTVLERLAKFACDFDVNKMEPEARELAKTVVFDVIGCIIGGSRDGIVTGMEKYVKDFGGAPMAAVIGQPGMKTDVCNAAMMGAMAAHVHDIDDINKCLDSHPTVPIFPAALAVGQEVNATGAEIFNAYVAGMETCSLLGASVNPLGFSYGWETLNVIGVMGVAVACGRLYKFDQEQMENAIAIAAAEASGLRANYGTMAKDINAGRASSNGVFAAQMAKNGYKARKTIFEDSNGYFATYANGIALDAILTLFDKEIKNHKSTYLYPGAVMKLYPACRGLHSSIDCALKIAEKNTINCEEIVSIECLPQDTAIVNNRYPIPKMPMEGKFSIPYAVSLALIHGEIPMKAFTGDKIEDGILHELLPKCTVTTNPNMTAETSYTGSEVIVTMKDGTVLHERVDFPIGDYPKNPIPMDKLEKKFHALLEMCIPADRHESILRQAKHFVDLQNIEAFIDEINASMSL